MDKYFTPSIEDIRVGYELETILLNRDGDKDWEQLERTYKPVIITPQNIGTFIHHGYMSYKTHVNRVPYLTKEQIEAEGWEVLAIPDRWIIHKKGCMELCYNYSSKELTPLPAGSRNVQLGQMNVSLECKDINTFRYICKLLNIN
jgi:hypothetical protein